MKTRLRRCYFLFTCCFFFISPSYAQSIYQDADQKLPLGREVYAMEDPRDTFSIGTVISHGAFTRAKRDVPNFGITTSSYWLRLAIRNETAEEKLLLELSQAAIDEVDFYAPDPSGAYHRVQMGEYLYFRNRVYNTPDYLFNIDLPAGATKTFYLRIKSKENMQVPVSVGSYKAVFNYNTTKSLVSGIYIGIMIVMILYNTFIFFIFRDSSYIKYAIYIVLIMLTQTSLQGYPFQYLWPDVPWLAIYSPFIFPVLVGIAGLEFMKDFLSMKAFYPRLNRLSGYFLIPYSASLILSFIGWYNAAFMVMEITASCVSVFMLISAYLVYRKGFRPARFFLLGWSVFLLGICIYVLKDFEILPYNNFTRYTMHFGSGLEVVLLSFALADRINILKREKEMSQAEALQVAKENERIIREQNVLLEQKVNERTVELQTSKENLENTLGELKEAQSQLVESEKMASLGQLTAGIAHEINNPINFVIANVNPLKRDISLLKDTIAQMETLATSQQPLAVMQQHISGIKEEVEFDVLVEEIDYLLKGISEGSERTAEIVKGLRIFARVDEDDLKKVNIHEGIDSTTIIVNTLLNNKVIIEKSYGELPLVECYPGKLNQVFLNIITNGIHAVRERYLDQAGGKITVATHQEDGHAVITISDNGTGMPAEVLHRIFDPFFTTKQVGEGTGLGLSIAYNIIKKHNGRISVASEPGKGTTFKIEIPVHQE